MFDKKTTDIAAYIIGSMGIVFAIVSVISIMRAGYVSLALIIAGNTWISYTGLSLMCGQRHFNLVDLAVLYMGKVIMGSFATLLFFASHKLTRSEIEDVTNACGVLGIYVVGESLTLGIVLAMRRSSSVPEPQKPE